MPSQGLSLVGFMDQPQAFDHLRRACISPDESNGALTPIWQAAKAKLGMPVPDAGHPAIRDIPDPGPQHAAQLMQQQWAQAASQQWQTGFSFKLVEIEPLLALQFTVDIGRSNHHCNGLSQPPTIPELLNLGLPIAPQGLKLQLSPRPPRQWPYSMKSPQAVVIIARGLNLRVFAQGIFNDPNGLPNAVGLQFGQALPLIQVLRLNGKCYLHNGFHRAVGARLCGAPEIACVFRDVMTPEEIGIDENTFSATLLDSEDPPTVGHFTQQRATEVNLRRLSTLIHVSWGTHVVEEEDT